MPDYRVTWAIDIFDAENPRAAALAAQAAQQNERPEYWCGSFEVTEHDTTETTIVDLDEVECDHIWVINDDDEELSYCEICGADGNA